MKQNNNQVELSNFIPIIYGLVNKWKEFWEWSNTDLQHERVRRVDEDGWVFSGRRLQAKLGVRRLGVVSEGDGAGQLAVVQHLLVVLGQVDVALWLELERALQWQERRRCERKSPERDRADRTWGRSNSKTRSV